MASLTAIQIESGSEGALDPSNGGDPGDVENAARALEYVYALCDWHEERAARAAGGIVRPSADGLDV
jgi:hypothetical protein